MSVPDVQTIPAGDDLDMHVWSADCPCGPYESYVTFVDSGEKAPILAHRKLGDVE